MLEWVVCDFSTWLAQMVCNSHTIYCLLQAYHLNLITQHNCFGWNSILQLTFYDYQALNGQRSDLQNDFVGQLFDQRQSLTLAEVIWVSCW